MSTQETAREQMTQQRQYQQHIQQLMIERSEEEIAAVNDADIQVEARKALAAQRQKSQLLEDSMQNRAATEVKSPDTAL